MMINITYTFGYESNVTGLTPNQQEQRHVQQLAPEVVAAAAPGEDDARLPAEVRAPGGVVVEQFAAEPPEDGGLERVNYVRRRLEAHLGVGEVEDQMLPLVPNVVDLEPEE